MPWKSFSSARIMIRAVSQHTTVKCLGLPFLFTRLKHYSILFRLGMFVMHRIASFVYILYLAFIGLFVAALGSL